MNTDMRTAIRRLELAMAFLSECDGDWYVAYEMARGTWEDGCEEDWAAIRDLIVIATHGPPDQFSYIKPDYPKDWDHDNEAGVF